MLAICIRLWYYNFTTARSFFDKFPWKEVKQHETGIHPEYKQTTIRCACGNVIETGSTKENIVVDVCSKCHPFFTGKQKLVDTGGRVDRFKKRFIWISNNKAIETCVRWLFVSSYRFARRRKPNDRKPFGRTA